MADASRRLPRRAARQRAPALHPLHLRLDRQAEGRPAHDRPATCSASSLTHKWVFDLKEDDIYWCTADVGWVTGHSYIVYGPLANGATTRHVRRGPEPPAARTASGRSSRSTSVNDLLHRPDGDPRLHQVGRPVAEEARPVEPAAARHRRRADQPRGVDVVSRGDRRRPLPDRRYLVADRDRRDHDLAAARRDRRPSPARATQAAARASSPRSWTSRAARCRPNQGGFLVIRKPWPRDAADDLRRRRALQAAVLEPGARHCYFTADGARRDEDGYFWIMGRVDDVLNVVRPPAEHDGGRERPGRTTRRSPRPRSSASRTRSRAKAIACFVTLEGGHRRRPTS